MTKLHFLTSLSALTSLLALTAGVASAQQPGTYELSGRVGLTSVHGLLEVASVGDGSVIRLKRSVTGLAGAPRRTWEALAVAGETVRVVYARSGPAAGLSGAFGSPSAGDVQVIRATYRFRANGSVREDLVNVSGHPFRVEGRDFAWDAFGSRGTLRGGGRLASNGDARIMRSVRAEMADLERAGLADPYFMHAPFEWTTAIAALYDRGQAFRTAADEVVPQERVEVFVVYATGSETPHATPTRTGAGMLFDHRTGELLGVFPESSWGTPEIPPQPRSVRTHQETILALVEAHGEGGASLRQGNFASGAFASEAEPARVVHVEAAAALAAFHGAVVDVVVVYRVVAGRVDRTQVVRVESADALPHGSTFYDEHGLTRLFPTPPN